MNEELTLNFYKDEVIKTLQDMRPYKASRVHGFLGYFYSKNWHIIGIKVADFCLQVLKVGI